MVDLTLSKEQVAVRETFAALFRVESPPDRVRAAERTGLDERLWRRYRETGALGIGVAEDLGGGGGGLLELALVAQEAGRRLAPIPFVESAVASRLLARLAAVRMLDQVLTGSLVVLMAAGASSATGAGGGAPVAAQLLPGGWIADAVLALVDGVVCWVPRPAELSAEGPLPNLGGLPMARWTGARPAVPLADRETSRAAFDAALDEVRVLRAAALAGLASEAIEIGARYAAVREAFGQPIGMYQAVAHPLADALTATDGAQLLVRKACWALEGGRDDGPELAAMAFVFAAETAYQAAGHSLHLHGGYGFMEEYDIQLYYRRAKAWAVSFADPRRELLTVAGRRFGPVGIG
jgi:alkylation response protein AidB-like acyl-CoA dehydrogenase